MAGLPVQRLAVVDPIGNDGGAMRFVRALLPALQRTRPGLKTTFFCNGESIRRDGVRAELVDAGIEVTELQWVRTKPWKSRPLRTRVGYKLRRRIGGRPRSLDSFLEANLNREIQAIGDDFDLAYFPWPYRLAVPKLPFALVTTIHDLNFKYFFGTPNFGSDETDRLDREIGDWLRAARAIASSQFMSDEIAGFYSAAPHVPVVRLAPFTAVRSNEGAQETVSGLGIRTPYVLCPTHLNVHKNLGPLVAAQCAVRERYPDVQLVLTGVGTEVASGRATPIGTVRDETNPDVVGLGYVSNQQMDSLIECASVVVNPSLYEAGNGSGLDAWSRATPVAMSDIPPFTEHLEALGVTAALFDPRDPRDIADKIGAILDDEPSWQQKAKQSKAAIDVFTWERTARGYLDVFDAAYTSSRHG